LLQHVKYENYKEMLFSKKSLYFSKFSGFFEFKDMLKFIKQIEKKVEQEENNIEFYEKYFINNGVYCKLENLSNLKWENKIIRKDFEIEATKALSEVVKDLGYEVKKDDLENILL
jgi:hypothetical protein